VETRHESGCVVNVSWLFARPRFVCEGGGCLPGATISHGLDRPPPPPIPPPHSPTDPHLVLLCIDGLRADYMESEPWSYWIGSGVTVHHDTCGFLVQSYVEKVVRRTLHQHVPFLQQLIWGEAPKPRPGEEMVYGV
jgi:hypothetical protein